MTAAENLRIGRRAGLGAAIGGAAALATGAAASPPSVFGDTGDVMHVGQDNTATATTNVLTTGAHAIYGQTNSGDGLRGWTDGNNGSGVFGYASDPAGFGVCGQNGNRGRAMLGTSGDRTACRAVERSAGHEDRGYGAVQPVGPDHDRQGEALGHPPGRAGQCGHLRDRDGAAAAK